MSRAGFNVPTVPGGRRIENPAPPIAPVDTTNVQPYADASAALAEALNLTGSVLQNATRAKKRGMQTQAAETEEYTQQRAVEAAAIALQREDLETESAASYYKTQELQQEYKKLREQEYTGVLGYINSLPPEEAQKKLNDWRWLDPQNQEALEKLLAERLGQTDWTGISQKMLEDLANAGYDPRGMRASTYVDEAVQKRGELGPHATAAYQDHLLRRAEGTLNNYFGSFATRQQQETMAQAEAGVREAGAAMAFGDPGAGDALMRAAENAVRFSTSGEPKADRVNRMAAESVAASVKEALRIRGADAVDEAMDGLPDGIRKHIGELHIPEMIEAQRAAEEKQEQDAFYSDYTKKITAAGEGDDLWTLDNLEKQIDRDVKGQAHDTLMLQLHAKRDKSSAQLEQHSFFIDRGAPTNYQDMRQVARDISQAPYNFGHALEVMEAASYVSEGKALTWAKGMKNGDLLSTLYYATRDESVNKSIAAQVMNSDLALQRIPHAKALWYGGKTATGDEIDPLNVGDLIANHVGVDAFIGMDFLNPETDFAPPSGAVSEALEARFIYDVLEQNSGFVPARVDINDNKALQKYAGTQTATYINSRFTDLPNPDGNYRYLIPANVFDIGTVAQSKKVERAEVISALSRYQVELASQSPDGLVPEVRADMAQRQEDGTVWVPAFLNGAIQEVMIYKHGMGGAPLVRIDFRNATLGVPELAPRVPPLP